MAAFKTHNLLPEIFRTETNKKFLNATLDQLVSEPNFTRVNGYIGRTDSPTYTFGDSYVPEASTERQNYQLEASSVVYDPEADNVNFYAGYTDLVNKIKYYGGKTNDHSRLFNNEVYSFDGKFDLDKFVNYGQYYWLPNGPDAVTVSATGVPLEKSYLVSVNNENNGYYFGSTRVDVNPDLTLAQGGVYEFVLDGLTGPFWIQSEPAQDGYNDRRPNVYTRDVYGVENNGASTGSVKFKVPKPEAQARFINMNNVDDVDYVSRLGYRELLGKTLAQVNALGGLDGKVTSLDNKKIIFANPTKIDDYYWTNPNTSEIVDSSLRTHIWLINIDQFGVVNLTAYTPVPVNEKVFIKSGDTYASKSLYVDYVKRFKEVPLITSNLTKLYYQSGDRSAGVGIINIVTVANDTLDPDVDIIGKVNFTSANGIKFTNGLKVTFDNSVPEMYAEKTYIVEGVGRSIRLIPFTELLSITSWQDNVIFKRGAGYAVGDVLTVVEGVYTTPAKLIVSGIVGEIDITEMTVGRPYRIMNFGDATATPGNFNEFIDTPDVAFTGTISGTTLTIPSGGISSGTGNLCVGLRIFGAGVPAGTRITALGTGVGGAGTYIINTTASIATLTSMEALAVNASFVYNGTPVTGNGTVSDGAITKIDIFDSGLYATLPTNPVTVTGGNGTAASFVLNLQPPTQEYSTINRGSLSRNAWSRSNRWFHRDVIVATAEYLKTDPLIDQNAVAKRPIIEFDPDVKLFDYGTVSISSIDKLDNLITSVYLQVESAPANKNFVIIKDDVQVIAGDFVPGKTYTITSLGTTDFVKIGAGSNRVNRTFVATGVGEGTGTAVESLILFNNSKVIFNNDATVANRKKIFNIVIADTGTNVPVTALVAGQIYEIVSAGTTNFRSCGARTNSPGTLFTATNVGTGTGIAKLVNYISTIQDTGEVINENSTVLVKTGADAGTDYWFNGSQWIAGQQKITSIQDPLFDVFDTNNISFGDTNTYNTSTFTGTKVFSYRRGAGVNDAVLGFPLAYRNFQTIGDILFDNNFDTDSFDYLATPLTKTVALNTGNLHIVTGLSSYTKGNMWSDVVEDSKQYQLISHSYSGGNNLFEIDILPEYSTQVPNIKVSLNNKFLDVANFGLTEYGARYAILINPNLLSEGDNVNIYIYSKTVSKLGYFAIPINLDNNSENVDFTQLTIGQLRAHLQVLGENSLNIAGDIIGSNNIRDTDIKRQVGNILKHAAPVIYSQLFLVDEQLNFVNGLRLAQKEYTKFKNKFLELSETVEIDINDIAASVDTIITQINGIKNSNFPWYYSDMVPWGDNKTTLPEYTVLELRNRRYDLSRIFDDTILSSRAVLVYHTRTYNGVTTKQLLVKGQDYVFDPDGPNFRINDTFNLNYGDIITVVEYNSTDGNFIPETPTKLGLWPKYVPLKYNDETYATPRDVIQGHDGSITPAFGDYRDSLLLELERRIYNNIKTEFRFDNIVNFLPGKFRDTEYTYKEYNQIVSNSFLSWTGNYRLDYTTNDYFQGNNPWTWNYKNFKDNLTGDYLPGYWRGIYKYFFDTDRPHTHPWEMLGFAEMPDWWIDRYGTAPYTGGNINLWSDLSLGYIHAGPRKGIDKRYARPGLVQIIPVDDTGNLKSPESFIVLDFDSAKANTSYTIGDHGPIETAWRRSSEFPFAVQLALALMKPAEYFGKLADVSMYAYDSSLKQYIVTKTNKHLIPTDIVANGHTNTDNTIQRSAGYINWITEYLKNLGIASPQTKIQQYLNYLSVQLSYKVGGYTDQNYLNILAEQSSPNSLNNSITIPDENYKIILNKSVPVNNVVYSAVIVEKSAAGYTVSGYNLNSPYFTIVPSQVSNNFYKITAGSESAVVYKDYQRARVRIPYGYEFTTKQQVVDFLVGYQRQLLSLGFVFGNYNDDLSERQDWILSAKEFLTWAQQGWGAQSLIILSPINDSITFSSKDSVVDEITNRPFGSKLLNPNFTAIKSNSFTVTRDRNKFVATTVDGQSIAYAELNLVQYEHVIIFDNSTVFGDIIYAPESGNRQYRLKLVGHKTADWTGALNPPGFVYNSEKIDAWSAGTDYNKGQLVTFKDFYYTATDNITGSDTFDNTKWTQIDQDRIKTGLLPNYASAAAQFENFYDLDNPPASEKLNRYSIGITGFRDRSYLTDLSLDTISQGKFYNGFIKQKGTKNSILALASAEVVNILNEVDVFEEWALRVGDYGATGSNEYVEVIIDEQVATSNPVALEFLTNNESPADGVVSYYPSALYKQSLNNVPAMFDPNNKTADRPGFPTGGYVNVDDVDTVIFDLANYRALSADLDKINTGHTIWTAKDFAGAWNVFRVNETNNTIVSLSYNLDNVATVTTKVPHGFAVDSIIAIKDFNDLYNGFYQVYDVIGSKTFNIVLLAGISELKIAQTITGVGYLFKLTSSRVDTPKNINDITPASGWLNNDKIWVDNLDADGNWGVYNKTSPWNYSTKLLQDTLNTYNVLGADQFGVGMAISSDGRRMFVGAPQSGRNIEENAENFIDGENYQIINIGDTDFTRIGATVNQRFRTFRANMALRDDVVGTTGTGTRRSRPGRVVIFDKQDDGSWKEINNLIGQDPGEFFGSKVLTSDRFLIITAPGKYNNRGVVYVYSIEGDITLIQILISPSGLSGSRFGSGIALSENGQWLYISEGATGKVYAYGYDNNSPYLTQLVTTNVANISLATTASDLYIRGIGTNNVSGTTFTTWIPEVDYTISNISVPVTTKSVSISHYATGGTAASTALILQSGVARTTNITGNAILGTNTVTVNSAAGISIGNLVISSAIDGLATVTGVSGNVISLSKPVIYTTSNVVVRANAINLVRTTANGTFKSNTITVDSTYKIDNGASVSAFTIPTGTVVNNVVGNTVYLSNSINVVANAVTRANGTVATNTLTVDSNVDIAVDNLVFGNGIAVGSYVTGVTGNVITLSSVLTDNAFGNVSQYTFVNPNVNLVAYTFTITANYSNVTVANSFGIAVGQYVYGNNVTVGTTVANVSGANILLSQPLLGNVNIGTGNLTFASFNVNNVSYSFNTNNQVGFFSNATLTNVSTGYKVFGHGVGSGVTVTGVAGNVITLSSDLTAFPAGLYKFVDPRIAVGQVVRNNPYLDPTTTTYINAISNVGITLSNSLRYNVESLVEFTFTKPNNTQGANIELFDVSGITVGQVVSGQDVDIGTTVTAIYGNIVSIAPHHRNFATGEYKFYDSLITFSPNITLPAGGVRIVRRPNYRLVQQAPGYTFRDPNGFVINSFAAAGALSCNSDGSQIIVGAPTTDAHGFPQAGKIHVYARSVEKFFGDGVTRIFTTSTTVNYSNLFAVRVNGILLSDGVEYLLQGTNQIVFFTSHTPTEGDIITVETNYFDRIQTLDGSTTATQLQVGQSYTIASLGDTNNRTNYISVGAINNQLGTTFVATGAGTGNGRVLPEDGKLILDRLGTFTTICPNSCSIYASAINYKTNDYGTGAIYRFVNQGQVYGEITGTVFNPFVTPGDSVKINGVTVELNSVTTDELVVDGVYKIINTGYTNWIELGASSNVAGTTFTANATGILQEANIAAYKNYIIKTVGNTNWAAIGVSAIASATGSANVSGNLQIYGTVNGTIQPGQQIFGANIPAGTKILGQVNDIGSNTIAYPGRAGVYAIDQDFTGIVSGPIRLYQAGQEFFANANGNTGGTGTVVATGAAIGLNSVVTDINAAFIPGVTATAESGFLKITSAILTPLSKLDIQAGKSATGPIGSTALTDLGLEVYVLSQIIKHPNGLSTENFGTEIRVSGDANQIAVGSRGASTIEFTSFDTGATTFDSDSMQFRDVVPVSGAVYLYDLLDNPFADVTNPALMGYVQQLQGPGLSEGFEFGSSIIYKNNTIFASAPKDNENGIQLFMDLNNSSIFYPSGSVYEFTNTGTQNGWDLLRVNQQRTSVDSISKLYLYNKNTQQVVARLDVYDPVKGKILGVADQDIDYKSEYDPATYNDSAGSDYQFTTINELYHWGPQQVGKTWWDLSVVRYVDYEQSDLNYRNKHWGSAMSGSEFKVYEWVESTVLPSQYNAAGGDGTVKYANNENYVSYTSVDPATGSIQVRYYYWVADKASVDVNVAKRTNSSYTLQQILSNPKAQGIAYAAPIAPNAISLFNIANYLVADDIVLHIDHSPLQNTNIIHNEYELFKEGDSSALPTRIINKLEDSLAGVDQALLPVPDPKLNDATRYGADLRPRQTMFVDRLAALENFVKFCNAAFLKYPIVDRSNLAKLFAGEELPVANSGEWDLTVDTHNELGYLNTNNYEDGYLVAVLADEYHSGHWVIYEWVNRTTTYQGNGARTIYKMDSLPGSSSDVTVKVNNVTVTNYTVDGRAVKFNTAPANGTTIALTAKEGWRIKRIQSYLTNLYWDKVDWFDTTRIDATAKTTYTVNNHYDLEKLTLVEGDTIKVINDGDGRFAWYIYENSTLDRVASEAGTIQISSTVYDLINNRLGYDVANYDNVRYDQYPVSEIRFLFESIAEDLLINDIRFEFNDLFFSMVNYIFSEQAAPDWIFKTSFITVLHKVRELLQYPSFIRNSETFYEDYIKEVKPYRTQIREYVQKETGTEYLHAGATDFDLPSYYDANVGTYRSPNGTITSDQALLETANYADWNNNYTYKITDIVVNNGGSGYNFIPNVTISGGGGTGAVAHLFVSNGSISGVEIISAGTGYKTKPTLTINGDGTGALLTPVLKNEYFAANNQQSYNVVRSFDSHIKFDRVVDSTNTGRRYNSNVVVWTANTAYTANIRSGTGSSSNIWLATGNFVAYDGAIYKPLAGANTTQQSTFDRNLYSKLDQGNVLINGIDRVIGYYSPGPGMHGGNIELLINSTEYPGVRVTGAAYTANTLTVSRANVFAFSSNGSLITSANTLQMNFLNFVDNNGVTGRAFAPNQQLRVIGSAGNDSAFRIVSVRADRMELAYSSVSTETVTGANITLSYLEETDLANYDAVISSSYLDTSLGQRPEDINVDGGAYVDTYSSYGPEELIPGRMYDALEMQVFTANTTSLDTNVFYIYRGTISNVGYGYYYPGVTTQIYDWMYTSAASIVAGQKYEIISQGSIDYTSIGAPNNNPGTVFVATGAGYGGSGAGNVFSVAHINAIGISSANLMPVVAANGSVTGITVISGGYGLANPWNPNVSITGANYIPATGNVYVEHDTYDTLGYRVFHTMNAPEYLSQANIANVHISYHRISAANTTVLTQDFSVTDSNIHVADASVLEPPNIELAIPGRIFINGEKVHYFLRDTTNNVLGYLRRAVDGTGAPSVHLANTKVVDNGVYQEFNVNATVRVLTGVSSYYANVKNLWGNPNHYDTVLTPGNVVANIKGISNVFAAAGTVTSNIGSPMVNGQLSYDTYRSYFGLTGDSYFRTEESLLNVGASTPADGLGLVASVDDNVLFLKQSPSYKP